MRECNKCDQKTEYKLCPECALEDRHGVPADDYDGDVEGDRRYRCRSCGNEFVASAGEDCPDCGDRNRKFIDYVDGSSGGQQLIADGGVPEDDEAPIPHQIRDAIEASDWPELSVREVMDSTGLSKDQILGAAGRGHGLEIDDSTGAVRLLEDDGGEFPDDHGRELRTDGSGFTMVDRDGNDLEPSDKFAGEHRDTGYERQGRQRIRGNQMPANTKWPDIRQAIIDNGQAVVKASEVAKHAGCDSGTVRGWLDKCEAKGFAECVSESRPGQSPKYRISEPDELPEVLHLQ